MDKYYITEEAFGKIFIYLSGKKSNLLQEPWKNKEIFGSCVFYYENRSALTWTAKNLWKL